jgi:MoxR-like ATPase
MARISMGYPAPSAELEMLDSHGARSPLDDLNPVTDAETINRVVHSVSQVHASPAVRQYIVDLVTRTRSTTALRLGASPRAALHLLRASRAFAALEGRDHVIPDDVQVLAGPVLAHRIMPSSETQLARRTTAEVVTDLLRQVPVPPKAR